MNITEIKAAVEAVPDLDDPTLLEGLEQLLRKALRMTADPTLPEESYMVAGGFVTMHSRFLAALEQRSSLPWLVERVEELAEALRAIAYGAANDDPMFGGMDDEDIAEAALARLEGE